MAGKKERQRRLARERYARQLERRSQRARRMRQRAAIGLTALGVAGIAVGGYVVFSPGGSKPAAAPSPTTSHTSPSAAPTQPAEPATHCTYISNPPAARNVGTPPATPDYRSTVQATIHTNRGDIAVNMLNSKATCTVNSFAYLAGKGYFNNTKCHRLTTTASGIYVLQCGDPTGTSNGGPGYRFGNENTVGATYPAGTLAMAHSGQPDSNGSQFFLVYQATQLPADYTPFGTVVSGLDIVKNVANAGVAGSAAQSGDGAPKESVVISGVTIKKT